MGWRQSKRKGGERVVSVEISMQLWGWQEAWGTLRTPTLPSWVLHVHPRAMAATRLHACPQSHPGQAHPVYTRAAGQGHTPGHWTTVHPNHPKFLGAALVPQLISRSSGCGRAWPGTCPVVLYVFIMGRVWRGRQEGRSRGSGRIPRSSMQPGAPSPVVCTG